MVSVRRRRRRPPRRGRFLIMPKARERESQWNAPSPPTERVGCIRIRPRPPFVLAIIIIIIIVRFRLMGCNFETGRVAMRCSRPSCRSFFWMAAARLIISSRNYYWHITSPTFVMVGSNFPCIRAAIGSVSIQPPAAATLGIRASIPRIPRSSP